MEETTWRFSEERKLTIPGQESEVGHDRAEVQHGGMSWLQFCEGQYESLSEC